MTEEHTARTTHTPMSGIPRMSICVGLAIGFQALTLSSIAFAEMPEELAFVAGLVSLSMMMCAAANLANRSKK